MPWAQGRQGLYDAFLDYRYSPSRVLRTPGVGRQAKLSGAWCFKVVRTGKDRQADANYLFPHSQMAIVKRNETHPRVRGLFPVDYQIPVGFLPLSATRSHSLVRIPIPDRFRWSRLVHLSIDGLVTSATIDAESSSADPTAVSD